MRFSIDITKRSEHLLVSILEEEKSIGSIYLAKHDEDLIEPIRECIKQFNLKYTEEPPQTTTGRDVYQGRKGSEQVG